MSANAAPDSAATANAAGSEPVFWTAQKPSTAPTSIIPSTPRLSTPERSVEQLAERRIQKRRAVDDRRGEHDDDDRVVDAGGQDHAAASALPERRSNAKR